uniref:Uncharacterized protein n=1 Tax=Glossina palpalis gambiensis TaxID=67801 RepID=A0A1B0BR00_9MUSC
MNTCIIPNRKTHTTISSVVYAAAITTARMLGFKTRTASPKGEKDLLSSVEVVNHIIAGCTTLASMECLNSQPAMDPLKELAVQLRAALWVY